MPGRRNKLLLSNERKLYKLLCHFIDTFDNPESTKTQVCHELENAGHGLRGCRPRKKPQVQNPHFQPVLKFAVAYLDRQNGEEFYGQMRQRLSYLVTMGRIKVRLSNLRTLQQHCQAWCWEHHGLELFSCLWYWYIPQSEWNNKEGELRQSPAQWTQFLSSAVIYWNNFKTCFK